MADAVGRVKGKVTKSDNNKIAIIGLGYVGLPLAIEFSKNSTVLGFDISEDRIAGLKAGQDVTLEVSENELNECKDLKYSSDPSDLRDCTTFIVTVPTPIDDVKKPNLSHLKMAATLVGSAMPENSLVIFESTVYPGCTMDYCAPILAQESGLKLNKQFFVGYSPERINPSDKTNRLPNIVKITSGSTPQTADRVDALYKTIITAGTHKVSSIEVAEAAKIVENTQRDLNIALMNEFAVIFNRLNIDTQEILAAAKTKWNFLPFTPGLVGGHCVGVDPYYLTYRAQQTGYFPEVILSGRKINDNMGYYVADQIVKLMMKRSNPVVGSKILVMGATFKENCPDLRNSRVIDIIRTLREYNANVDVWDPWVDIDLAKKELDIVVTNDKPSAHEYDVIVVAVAHDEFKSIGTHELLESGTDDCIIYDVKYILEDHAAVVRL